jgi:hypothetical protein
VFINGLCYAVATSKYIPFVDDIKIYRAIKYPEGCNLLQCDIISKQGWCTANRMKLNISKTKVIYFLRKTNLVIYDYKLCQSSIIRTDSIKDLGIFTDTKLHIHNHVNHIFSHCIKLPVLVRSITFTLSSLECLHRLHITLARSKPEYASIIWNSITYTDANKLDRIQ